MVVKKKKDERNTDAAKAKQVRNGFAQQTDPELRISRMQDLQLEIIKHTNFNNCDGVKIAMLLRENRLLWRAVMMKGHELWPLRNMEDDNSLFDTLCIYARDGYQAQLEELAREQFDADEVHWIGGEEATYALGTFGDRSEIKSQVILSVWWD
jgi:hypothetical protein